LSQLINPQFTPTPSKTPSIAIEGVFDGGVFIFSKMERTFFFLGFCPPSIRAVWRGFNADSVLPKLFSGEKNFAKPRLAFVFVFCPRGEGAGEECGRVCSVEKLFAEKNYATIQIS